MTRPLIFCALLYLPAAYAQSCNIETARSTVTSFLNAAGSNDCLARLKEINAGDHWLQECQRREGPHKQLHREFSQRTKFSLEHLEHKGKEAYAIIHFSGPAPMDFQLALLSKGRCSKAENNSIWPDLSDGKPCDESFWRDIPVSEYDGALPIECRHGEWIVINPPNDDKK